MSETLPRTQDLASCYENSLTIILRLFAWQRSTSANAQDFRASIRAALKAAMEQAKTLGYSSETNQLAFFAVVAFLDESVLKLQSPAFADWAQRPLQEEMFGHNRAGEVFFDHLRTLLAREDSSEVADCLEVFCICMLLGFKGKYALGPSSTYTSGPSQAEHWGASRASGELQALIRQCRLKIDRIRGQAAFMPDESPVPLKQTAVVDRWSRGLGIAAVVLFAILLLSFSGAWIVLSSGASQLG